MIFIILSSLFLPRFSLREWRRLGLVRKPISIFFVRFSSRKREKGGGREGDATVRWSDEIAFHGWTVGLFAARQATALQCCSLVDNDKPLLESCPRKIAESNSALYSCRINRGWSRKKKTTVRISRFKFLIKCRVIIFFFNCCYTFVIGSGANLMSFL